MLGANLGSLLYGDDSVMLKENIFDSITIKSTVIFLPFMTFIKNCFQSEILRTVNSTNSFNFVHLAKNYGALHFTDSIQYLFST